MCRMCPNGVRNLRAKIFLNFSNQKKIFGFSELIAIFLIFLNRHIIKRKGETADMRHGEILVSFAKGRLNFRV